MRVLYYNWTPIEQKHAGGGVSVYLYNLFQYFSSHQTSIQPVFLSSGYYYDNKHRPYITERECYMGIENYCLVNSPIIAPQFTSFSVYRRHLDDKVIIRLFRQFLIDQGPFDVIHFHSFEGLTTKVLQLKSEFQNTLFVHTIHDYGLFCPTVRFWTYDARNCALTQGQVYCYSCVRKELVHRYTDYLVVKRMLDGRPHRMTILDRVARIIEILHTRLSYKIHDYFEDVRRQNVKMVNSFSDGELCVSHRVMDIATSHGINSSKCIVSYIGTLAASSYLGQCRTAVNSPVLTILFMGSAAPEKGLDTLLSALECIDSSRCTIALKVAAGIDDVTVLRRLDVLGHHLAGVIHYNGYTHQDFGQIMQDVNLGVVPPLWEDNLPQVAIEMIAHGIPIITGIHGGAQELNTHPCFLFTDSSDLQGKIEQICNHRNLLNDYWSYVTPLMTMELHVNQLQQIYSHELR